jgi:hypothetical protein
MAWIFKRALIGTLALLLIGCQSSRPIPDSGRPGPVRWAKAGLSVYRTLGEGSVPEQWLSEGIDFTATELNEDQFDAAREALHSAAASFPPGYFDQNPTRVYLLASMRIYGIPAGGTAWAGGNTVYVVFSRDEGHLGELKLQRWFYSELGTVIYKQHQHLFPTEAWLAANPADFEYSGGSVAAVKAGKASTSWTLRDLREGFLGEYGRSVLDKDVVLYITEALVNEPAFRAVRHGFPRIDAKAELTEAFLRRVHPGFTEAWFASIEPMPSAPGN